MNDRFMPLVTYPFHLYLLVFRQFNTYNSLKKITALALIIALSFSFSVPRRLRQPATTVGKYAIGLFT